MIEKRNVGPSQPSYTPLHFLEPSYTARNPY